MIRWIVTDPNENASSPTTQEATSIQTEIRRPIVEWIFPEGTSVAESDFVDAPEEDTSNRILNAEATYVVDPNETEDLITVEGKIVSNLVEKCRSRKCLVLCFVVVLSFLVFAVLLISFRSRESTHNNGKVFFSLSPSLLPSLSPHNKSSLPSSTPTLISSGSPSSIRTVRQTTMTRILSNVSGGVLLQNNTFQNKALRWILHDDYFDTHYADESEVSQRYGAMLFYFSLRGESWTNADGYGSGSHVCHWYGVHCTDEKVDSLTFTLNNLHGKIPEEIGTVFPFLRLINLRSNAIQGTLPKSLFFLEHLTEINIARNYLTGGLPDELGNLYSLEILRLTENLFSGSIPSSIGNNVNLIELILRNNMITGSIPTELAGLKNIESLSLNKNLMTNTIPPEFASYDSFRNVLLSENGFNGTVPDGLFNGRNVMELTLSENLFTGTLPEIVNNLSWLMELRLNNNRFVGTVPDSWSLLRNVDTLIMFKNNIHGTIPTLFGNLVSMQTLVLSWSSFTGRVPTEIGNLTRLRTLRLEKNELSGTMPLEICRLDLVTLVSDCKAFPEGEDFCSCCTNCFA